jgi:acyl dehydratase
MYRELTGESSYFENFSSGQRMRHARGTTIGEMENQFISKLVMNTAEAHWNEHSEQIGPFGPGRVVFGLVTAAVIFGLASQDIAENALAELSVTGLRFLAPVHHGDTLYAFSEVLATGLAPGRADAGILRVKHVGLTHDKRVVFEGERSLLVKRRTHWGDLEEGQGPSGGGAK